MPDYATYLFWAALGLSGLAIFNYVVGDTLHLSDSLRVPTWSYWGAKIPLREAAIRAYEELREGTSVWATAADSLRLYERQTREEFRIDFIAQFIMSRIPPFGKHPPSRKFEEIDKHELKNGGLENGAKDFQEFHSKEPTYIDLSVNRSDLRGLIEEHRHAKLE